MSFMEEELRKMFGKSVIVYESVFCGKTMIGKINRDLRAKIEFVSTYSHSQYNALCVTIINRKEGIVDATTFNFRDIIGSKEGFDPHIWNDGYCLKWRKSAPSLLEYTHIANRVLQYIKLFAEE